MIPERWSQVKRIIGEALEIEPGARSAFLNEACGADAELRTEVESILAGSGERIEEFAGELNSTLRAAHEETRQGERLGAYEINRDIGRGGMGTVYLARRADAQFEKQVAIKILKRGTDTDEVLRRFRSEREILARLEHPNIARLLDAGTTDDGLPYFVMDYIVGQRVTDYCFTQNLSIPGRLQLFRKICEAVRFAHQNLVVHRDLKPANILVTADGEPKLLDFGIAKLLAVEEGSLHLTIPDRQRLTPAYASPEQVRGDPVTTVSDVYTLGALLYEILVGRSPHRFAAAHPSPTELWQVVSERAAIRPSVAAADRPTARRLRGDLDNILLTALRKEPARRYSGAGAFAEDIRLHLEQQPVRARPATFGYRAGKFFGRNKVASLSAVVVLAALVAGAAITVVNARRAEMEARRAARHSNDVRQLANAFLFEFHDAIAGLPGATAARQLVVSRALPYLDKLAREAVGDRRLQLELAEAYLRIGDIQGKPYTANLGDSAGALRSYTEASEIVALWAQRERGTSRAEAREKLVRAQLALAAVMTRAGQLEPATAMNNRALDLLQQLAVEAPRQEPTWQRLTAECHLGLGDAIQAGNHERRNRALFRAAVENYLRALPPAEQLVAADPQNTSNLRLLAKVCARIAGPLPGSQGETPESFDEALRYHARNTELQAKALGLEPDNIHLRRNLADGLVATAFTRMTAHRDLDRALAECERALALQESIAAADPANKEALQDLSYAAYNTGRVQQMLGNPAAAAERYQQAINILEPLVSASPGNVETAFDLDRARQGLAETEPGQPRMEAKKRD